LFLLSLLFTKHGCKNRTFFENAVKITIFFRNFSTIRSKKSDHENTANFQIQNNLVRKIKIFAKKLKFLSKRYVSMKKYLLLRSFSEKITPNNIMYAIVDIAGQQFKVEKDKKIFVHRLQGEEGDELQFENVMLIESEDGITVGKPYVDGASVSAKILSHLKGDKVIVFKKKRRKGYQKENGHRQFFSQIQVESITVGE
jgi:large subunit ribosomal protein L21